MMHLVGTWYLTSLLVVSGLARLNNLNTIESYMDICILGTHHKTSPSQEKGLTSKVSATDETAQESIRKHAETCKNL